MQKNSDLSKNSDGASHLKFISAKSAEPSTSQKLEPLWMGFGLILGGILLGLIVVRVLDEVAKNV